MNTQTVETGEASAAMGAASAPEAATTSSADATPTAAADSLLHLGAGLEIKDVETVHKQLTSMLERGPSITLDISHVAAMDTAGVQLLLAFQSEAAEARRGDRLQRTIQCLHACANRRWLGRRSSPCGLP